MMPNPSPLSDFVSTYDEVSHDDWDPEVDVEIWDEYEETDQEFEDSHDGMTREQFEDWLENGP